MRPVDRSHGPSGQRRLRNLLAIDDAKGAPNPATDRHQMKKEERKLNNLEAMQKAMQNSTMPSEMAERMLTPPEQPIQPIQVMGTESTPEVPQKPEMGVNPREKALVELALAMLEVRKKEQELMRMV